MNVSDERINLWAREISETEEGKCQNALSQVSAAVRDAFGYDVTILQQGSHRNRTNIRADSDVDIAVVHRRYYFPETSRLSPADKMLYEVKNPDATYSFETFKEDVHKAMSDALGVAAAVRKNKCIRVAGNTNRVSADVVPTYEYKRFKTVDAVEAEGIALKPDRGTGLITSFPEQHYTSGVAKNTATSRAFKAVVRVLKNARNDMIDNGMYPGDAMSSFFIECLVWNVPNEYFMGATWRDRARSVALQVWSDMQEPAKADNYAEVSDLKWLFRGQSRTPAQAEAFALKVWTYLEP